MSEKFEITEPGEYVLRNGERFIVKCVDWPGAFPIVGHLPGGFTFAIRYSDGRVSTTCESETDIVAKYEEPPVDLKSYVGKVVFYMGHKHNAARLVLWAGDDSVSLASDEGVSEYRRKQFLEQYKLAEDSE